MFDRFWMLKQPPYLLFAFGLVALFYCASDLGAQSKSNSSSNLEKPQYLYEKKILPEKRFELNDLILILVDESGSASNNSSTNLRRKFDLKADIKEWVSLEPLDLAVKPETAILPGVDLTSEKKLEGRGTTDRREAITFRIMSRVVDIRPNGNLLLEARKTRLINNEESILTIFGEVNPKDISATTKAVRSERIADLKLAYSGTGPVSRNLGQSYFTWLLDWIWPF